jgi:DNA-binding transcriptional ArsR family regulator
MAMQLTDPLSLAFHALADPTRRAILARLAEGDADVSQLTEPFGLSQPTISKHLQVLERAGLVARGRDAQRRPRALVAAPLAGIDRWLESYRASWEGQFQSLDAHLRRTSPPPAKKSRRNVTR